LIQLSGRSGHRFEHRRQRHVDRFRRSKPKSVVGLRGMGFDSMGNGADGQALQLWRNDDRIGPVILHGLLGRVNVHRCWCHHRASFSHLRRLV